MCKTPECLLNIWPTHIHVIIYGIILGVSAIGIVNNLTCIYIFTTCKSMKNSFFHLRKVKQKFPQCLISVTEFKFYSRCIHSIVFWSISTILLYLLGFFFRNKQIFIVDGMDWFDIEDFDFVFYYTYIYIVIWSVLYTFGSLLDIQIVYSRIQMFYVKLKFLRNQSVYK